VGDQGDGKKDVAASETSADGEDNEPTTETPRVEEETPKPVAPAAPVGETSTPKPDSPTNDNSHRATIVVAIVSLVSSVIGGCIAGGATYLTTNANIRAQQEQSDKQFARDNRRDQYANILQQATRLDNAGTFGASALTAFGASDFLGDLTSAGWANGVAQTGPLPERVITGPAITSLPPEHVGGQLPPGSPTGTDIAGLSGLAKGIGNVRTSWQTAYTGLDQAISNAQLVASPAVINCARALRDKYRIEYYNEVLKSLGPPPPGTQSPDKQFDAGKIADAIVGVQADTGPPTYDPAWLNESTDQLTARFVQTAQDNLDLPED
jgi:hypothetical protein